jgi:hypothetical protein
MSPTKSNGVTVGGVNASLLADSDIPTTRGEPATLNLRLSRDLEITQPRHKRRAELLKYEEFAGEAALGRELGGVPFINESPQPAWPVDSHIVAVEYGSDIATESIWGYIQAVTDESTLRSSVDLIGEQPYGDDYGRTYGSRIADANTYRVSLDIVKLAPLSEYATRDDLVADLSPDISQL